METAVRSKFREKISAKKSRGQRRAIAARPLNLAPGKSIEQLRLEAVARLREIGLYI